MRFMVDKHADNCAALKPGSDEGACDCGYLDEVMNEPGVNPHGVRINPCIYPHEWLREMQPCPVCTPLNEPKETP
jgi:hypothetical protein